MVRHVMAHAAVRAAANVASWCLGAGLPDAATALDNAGLAPNDRAEIAEPLAQLLDSCTQEAALSPLGRAGLRWDIARCLANLRRLAEEETRTPAILETAIAAPLIVSGMPRSGTTFLHRLLACDLDAASPRCWQTMHPYPDPTRPTDTRIQTVDRQLAGFALLAPELRDVHPMDSRSPQECTEITATVFQSLRFETVYQVPSYKRWLTAHGHAAAYRFHRRFLQHLTQGETARRWVLKCPDHVFALGVLRSVYPDARVIFLHRDPLHVLPSVAHLTSVLRGPFSRRIDHKAIGRQVLEDWTLGAGIMVAEATRPRLAATQVLHLRYRDLIAWPLETVALIYRYFDMELSPPARAAMAALIEARPRGGYARNTYDLETYGLSVAELRSCFAEYSNLFHVTPESEPSKTLVNGFRLTPSAPD
jgi:Sulfotransferase family